MNPFRLGLQIINIDDNPVQLRNHHGTTWTSWVITKIKQETQTQLECIQLFIELNHLHNYSFHSKLQLTREKASVYFLASKSNSTLLLPRERKRELTYRPNNLVNLLL